MSILNVNQIQPVGSGQTVTISAANIIASSSTITASSITATSGNLTGISSVSTTNLTVNGNAIWTSLIDITSFSGLDWPVL